MLQTTFDNYRLATADASVRLTQELLKDINLGKISPILNGKPVSLREKTIAVKMLQTYSDIFQEHTLTDIADRDVNDVVADNRMSRREMQELLEGINIISGLGLNSSEDFVLDRIPIEIPDTTITLSVVQEVRNGRPISIRITLNSSVALSSDTIFTLNDGNSGGTGSSEAFNITIPSGSTIGTLTRSFSTPPLNGYSTTFTVNDVDGFEIIPVGGISITVLPFTQSATLSVQSSRIDDRVTFRLRITTNFAVSEDTTFSINDSNSGGTGNSINSDLTINSGNNTAFIDLSFTPSNVEAGYTTIFSVNPLTGFNIIPEGGISQTVDGIVANQTNISVVLQDRTAINTAFRITVTTTSNVDTNTTFAVNITNAFGPTSTSNVNVIIQAGQNSGFVTINSASADIAGYVAGFALDTPLPSGFGVGTGTASVIVSPVQLNVINVVASILTRTAVNTGMRLVFTTDSNVTTSTTVSVLITNPYGLGPGTSITVSGVIPSGTNTVTVDVSSDNAATSSYTATLAFVTPLQLGLGAGTITTSLNFDSLPVWELDSFSGSTSGFLDLGSLVSQPEGMWINDAGTFLFIVSNAQTRAVFRYNLSTPYDMTTGVYSGQSFNPTEATVSALRSVLFNSDGTKMFLSADELSTILNIGGIYEYDLATAFDITTATYSGTFLAVETDNSIEDVLFNNDGTLIYVCAGADEYIDTYTLSTAFDLSTSGNRVRTSFSSDVVSSAIASIDIGKNGERLYIADGINRILQYNLSTAYDISTAVLTKTRSSQGFDGGLTSITVRSVKINSIGNRMYIVDDSLAGSRLIRQIVI